MHDPPPRLPAGVPRGLQEALDRALAKDPRDRHQSAAELAEDVVSVLAG